jgi:hypothetical protein
MSQFPQLYYYDRETNTTRPVQPISEPEIFPPLTTIKSLLTYTQNGMGVLTPFSILTVNENAYLNELNLGQLNAQSIINADLDGGNFP